MAAQRFSSHSIRTHFHLFFHRVCKLSAVHHQFIISFHITSIQAYLTQNPCISYNEKITTTTLSQISRRKQNRAARRQSYQSQWVGWNTKCFRVMHSKIVHNCCCCSFLKQNVVVGICLHYAFLFIDKSNLPWNKCLKNRDCKCFSTFSSTHTNKPTIVSRQFNLFHLFYLVICIIHSTNYNFCVCPFWLWSMRMRVRHSMRIRNAAGKSKGLKQMEGSVIHTQCKYADQKQEKNTYAHKHANTQ